MTITSITTIEQCRTLTTAQLGDVLGGISRDTISRMVKRGELPKPIKVGGSNHWLETQVFQFIEREQSKVDAMGQAA